jgi:hypothetical protein
MLFPQCMYPLACFSATSRSAAAASQDACTGLNGGIAAIDSTLATKQHSIGDGECRFVLSGVPGLANNAYELFRFLGDRDGNGTVNTTAFSQFAANFLKSVPTSPVFPILTMRVRECSHLVGGRKG